MCSAACRHINAWKWARSNAGRRETLVGSNLSVSVCFFVIFRPRRVDSVLICTLVRYTLHMITYNSNATSFETVSLLLRLEFTSVALMSAFQYDSFPFPSRLPVASHLDISWNLGWAAILDSDVKTSYNICFRKWPTLQGTPDKHDIHCLIPWAEKFEER